MTEKEISEYHRKVNENIRKHGWHSTFVSANKSPSFSYSTGIFENFSIPEVFISSLPPNLSFELIDRYIKLFGHAKEVILNTRIDNLTDRFPVYLIEVPVFNLKNYVLSSVRFYKNDDYKYVQLVYPDTEGHFPNHPKYDYDQEIVGGFID